MVSPSDKLTIRLQIGKKMYPLSIERAMEEIYREAASQINAKLGQYQTAYPNQDAETYMAVSILDFATRAITAEREKNTADINEAMAKLTKEIESALKGNGEDSGEKAETNPETAHD